MTELDYDCLQKRGLTPGVLRRMGEVTQAALPSDKMSSRELQSRNGPCRSYRLGEPMTRRQFEAMPEDLRRLYLRRLAEHGGTEESVRRMLSMDQQRLQRYGIRFDRPDRLRWILFLHRRSKHE